MDGKTISTDKFTFSFQGLWSTESFLNLEPWITEQLANEKMLRKKIRPGSRFLQEPRGYFFSWANCSANCGQKFKNDSVVWWTWNEKVNSSVDIVLVLCKLFSKDNNQRCVIKHANLRPSQQQIPSSNKQNKNHWQSVVQDAAFGRLVQTFQQRRRQRCVIQHVNCNVTL